MICTFVFSRRNSILKEKAKEDTSMSIITLLSLCVTLAALLLSVLFKIAGRLRFTLPLFYLLLTATLLNKWAASHETLAFFILFLLTAFSLFSWGVSFYRKWKGTDGFLL